MGWYSDLKNKIDISHQATIAMTFLQPSKILPSWPRTRRQIGCFLVMDNVTYDVVVVETLLT